MMWRETICRLGSHGMDGPSPYFSIRLHGRRRYLHHAAIHAIQCRFLRMAQPPSTFSSGKYWQVVMHKCQCIA